MVNPDTQTALKGPVCNGCELQSKRRVPGCGTGGGGQAVDIMIVSESPSSWSVNNNQLFYGRGGRIIRQTWKELRELDHKNGGRLKISHLKKWETYAVQCQVEEGNQTATTPKSVIDRCGHYLLAAVKNKRPKVILALGASALKGLGYRGEKFMEARGRLLDMNIGGHACKVLPTFSTKHLVAKTGLYNLFYNDFIHAVRLAAGVDQELSSVPLEELTKDYRFPKTVEEVESLCNEIIEHVTVDAPPGSVASQCALAVDIETNTKYAFRKDAAAICISFAWDTGRATAIPLWHKDGPWSSEQLEQVVGHVQRVLLCAKPKIFHNAKFDLQFLELRHGLKVNNYSWDTMLGEHLLREDMSGAYGLKILGRSYFPQFSNYADKVHEFATQATAEEEAATSALVGVKKGKVKKGTPGFDEGMASDMSKEDVEKYLFGSKKDRKRQVYDSGYERVPQDILLVYAAIDTDLTRRLLRNQFIRMKQENFPQAKSLMQSHCLPATRTLGKMEFRGMRVDIPYNNYLEQELTKVVAAKESILHSFWEKTKQRGKEFNPNSNANLSTILYVEGVADENDQLRIRLGPWVERNAKSMTHKTDKKTLRAIVEHTGCDFAKNLLEYRAAHKALSGFIHDIKLLSDYDGYLHTNFLLHGTSTGRLSSNSLNMQNLPAFLAGFNIKKVFIPDDPEEEVVFNLDYKGAEIRVFTAYARDQALIDALNAGLDVHCFFTQEIYGIPYEEVDRREDLKTSNPERYRYLDKLRTNVKRVVFGILYGAMAKKIAETAGISEQDAQHVIDKLFARFPSLKDYMDETVAHIHQFGYVTTLFGRRRRFPLQAVNGFFRGRAERQGKNMRIQSTSSEIVVAQLNEVDEHIGDLGGRLCLTVHDSLVGTCKKKYIAQLPEFFQRYGVDRVTEKFDWLPVAFTADIGIGPSYGEVISLEKYMKQHSITPKTADEMLLQELDDDAIVELREDEDEAREQATMVAAFG